MKKKKYLSSACLTMIFMSTATAGCFGLSQRTDAATLDGDSFLATEDVARADIVGVDVMDLDEQQTDAPDAMPFTDRPDPLMCEPGSEPLGTNCVAVGAFPRQIVPLSLGDVSLLRPTLRWVLPEFADGAQLEICRDRACTMIIETTRVVGSSARPAQPLPVRSAIFWRLRATVDDAVSVHVSPTWLFHTPARENPNAPDTSNHAHVDFNGDGIDDIAVGAPDASPGDRANAGYVSIFLGSPMGVPMNATRVIEGLLANDNFGYSVAGAGDLNGDGFGELVVGGISDVPGEPGLGTVRVFHGSALGLLVAPTAVLTNQAPTAGHHFGYSVASAGDLNGDGFGELLVGDISASPSNIALAGSASVFYGTASGVPMLPAVVLAGTSTMSGFGRSVAGAGDVNNDGFGDVVVGADFGQIVRNSNFGTATLYYGNMNVLTGTPGMTFTGDRAFGRFGASVAGAGDLNGDGYPDIVVGAPDEAPGGRTSAGRVRIFNGGLGGITMIASLTIEATSAGERFGNSVANARDLNGDGFGDLVVGAETASPRAVAAAGRASVFYGSAMGVPTSPTLVLEGVAANNNFGHCVAGAGDLNADGFGDIIVGTHHTSPGARRNAGTVSVFLGSAMAMPLTPIRTLEGGTADDAFGYVIASINDRLRTLTTPWTEQRLGWRLLGLFANRS